MINYLQGNIIVKKDRFIILEVNHVGYKVFLSRKTLSTIPEMASSIKLFCFHNVKEDASDLYGFTAYDALELFEMLMEVRGVGPKAALEISSLGSLAAIKDKVLKQDERIFEGIPGIGAKKAMAIILELTGKIRLLDSQKAKGLADPAEDALVQLGFSKQQAKEALAGVPSNIQAMEERITQALKNLDNS